MLGHRNHGWHWIL